MFKVCIISCGMITNSAHIPAYRNFSEDYLITAVCDTNETAARDTAERHGIPNYYTDAEEMLKAELPDIVSVCVPNFLHKEMTMLALSYGCHVVCEKPVAFTLSDAKEMYGYAEKQGKILMAAQSMRFTPDRMAAKAMIDRDEIGNIYYGEFARIRRRGIPFWGTFHMKRYSGGGSFVDLGVHMLDALVWLMGNPKLKSAVATCGKNHASELGDLVDSGALTGQVHTARQFDPKEMDVEDFCGGSLLFENDIRINFTVCWAANMPEASDIRLIGQKKSIYIPQCSSFFGASGDGKIEPVKNLYPDEAFPGHFYLMDNLRKALKGEEALIVKPEETINVSEIIEAVYQSAKLKKEVRIHD